MLTSFRTHFRALSREQTRRRTLYLDRRFPTPAQFNRQTCGAQPHRVSVEIPAAPAQLRINYRTKPRKTTPPPGATAVLPGVDFDDHRRQAATPPSELPIVCFTANTRLVQGLDPADEQRFLVEKTGADPPPPPLQEQGRPVGHHA